MTTDACQCTIAINKAKKKPKKQSKMPKEERTMNHDELVEPLEPPPITGKVRGKETKRKKDSTTVDANRLKRIRKDETADVVVSDSTGDSAATLLIPEDVPSLDKTKEGKKKKEKKKKKDSKGGAGLRQGAIPPAQLAAVGNSDLARSRPPLIKNLYTPASEVQKKSPAEVATLRELLKVAVEGSDLPPIDTFQQTGLPSSMLQATRSFLRPSPIQSQCWPIILAGHDLIGIAATGSGKTLAFGLPALRHIQAQRDGGVVTGRHGPLVLVMAPTRELALQINEVLADAGSACGFRSLCVYGGVPKGPQVSALKQGVEIVAGTPGRLEDLINDGVCRMEDVSYLVLDEADRMLDLGFEPHIRAICSKVRGDRQTLMFSATWPTAVQKLAHNFLSNPVKVVVGSQDLSASHSVKQVVEVVDGADRENRLLQLLGSYHSSRKNRVIIFVLYKKEAPRLESLLQKKGWKAVAIHGDISQHQRTRAVEQFKEGSIPLLIATDVAARGLDIPDVEVVINFSFPLTVEDYVHRIGRTGRAGKSGMAHTFFQPLADKGLSGALINVLREAGQQVPEELLKCGTTVKKKEHKLYGSHFKEVDINKKATKMTFDSDDE